MKFGFNGLPSGGQKLPRIRCSGSSTPSTVRHLTGFAGLELTSDGDNVTGITEWQALNLLLNEYRSLSQQRSSTARRQRVSSTDGDATRQIIIRLPLNNNQHQTNPPWRSTADRDVTHRITRRALFTAFSFLVSPIYGSTALCLSRNLTSRAPRKWHCGGLCTTSTRSKVS